jgi:hypothetical protein
MRARPVQTWSARRLGVRRRLARICTGSLRCLLGVTTQHARAAAAQFSGRHTAPCSQMVQAQSPVAVSTLESLSTPHATHVAKTLHKGTGLPWQRARRVESPLQHRASRPPENATRFNHGSGLVSGHQWPPSVCILHDLRMPLRPIPFSRQRECRAPALADQTAPALVSDALRQWDLGDARGSYEPRAVVVRTDRGDDNTKSATARANTGWHVSRALGKTRRVQAATLALPPPVEAVGSSCHVRAPSSLAHVATHASHDAWDEAEAHGVARPRHAGVSALCGARPRGVLSTSPATGWAPPGLRLP